MNQKSLSAVSVKSDVEAGIKSLLTEVLFIDAETVPSLDMNEIGLLTKLGVNSIDAFELIVCVEERFGFEFSDEELNPQLVDPLNQLVLEVCRKLNITDS